MPRLKHTVFYYGPLHYYAVLLGPEYFRAYLILSMENMLSHPVAVAVGVDAAWLVKERPAPAIPWSPIPFQTLGKTLVRDNNTVLIWFCCRPDLYTWAHELAHATMPARAELPTSVEEFVTDLVAKITIYYVVAGATPPANPAHLYNAAKQEQLSKIFDKAAETLGYRSIDDMLKWHGIIPSQYKIVEALDIAIDNNYRVFIDTVVKEARKTMNKII